MKLGGQVPLALFLISFVNCADYKCLKMFNCSSSDEGIFSIDICANSQAGINVTFNVKKPLDKIDVSDVRQTTTASINFHIDRSTSLCLQ
jgi:hypothetical protein